MGVLRKTVSKVLLSCFPGAVERPNRSEHMQDYFGAYCGSRGRIAWLKWGD